MKELERAADFLARGRHRDALELFEREHLLNPRDPVPLRGAGAALKQLGRHEEAIDHLMRSTWLIARHAETWGLMASCAYALRKYEDAVRYWREAITIDQTYFASRANEERCWRDARSYYSEFDAPLRRIVRQDRLAEVPAFLEQVRTAQDVAEAIRIGRRLLEEQGGSLVLPFVIALLELLNGESSNLTTAVVRDARSVTRSQQEWIGCSEQLLNAFTRSAPEHLGALSLAFLHEADGDLARVVYRYTPEFSAAHVASLRRVGTGLLRYLRERATA